MMEAAYSLMQLAKNPSPRQTYFRTRAMEEFQRVALIAVADRALALDTGKGLGQMGYKVVLTVTDSAGASGTSGTLSVRVR